MLVMHLSGDLDVNGAQALRSFLSGTVTDQDRYVVFDMTDVPYINSQGLGAIIGFLKTLQLREGQLFIINTQQRVKNVFMISSLENKMLFLDSLDDARRIASGESIA